MSQKNKQAEQRFAHYLGVVSDGLIAKAAGLKLPAVTWWRTQRNIKGLGIRRSALDPYMHWFANSTLSPEAIFERAGYRLPPKAMHKYNRDPHGMAMRLARRAAFLHAYEGLTLQPIPPNLLVPRSKGATLRADRIERGDYFERAAPEPVAPAMPVDETAGAAGDDSGPLRGRPGAVGQEGGQGAEGEREGESVNLTPWRPITVSFELAIVRGAEAYLSPEDVEANVRAALSDMLDQGDMVAELPDEIAVGLRMKRAAGGDDWDIAVVFGD